MSNKHYRWKKEYRHWNKDYWNSEWEKEMQWHRASNGATVLHSKHPQRPPPGFVRLGYAKRLEDWQAGPNYVYVSLAWVKEIYPDGRIRIRTHATDSDGYVDLDALSVKWLRRKLAKREGAQLGLALN